MSSAGGGAEEDDEKVRCWTDYVRKGGTDDLFYNTSDFSSVSIPREYIAGTDYKDAFRGNGGVSLNRCGLPSFLC